MSVQVDSSELDVTHGVARVHVSQPAATPRGLIVLGHGAGGGIDAPDLVAVTDVAVALGCAVVRVEQPYRVAGRRAPAPARQLDANWIDVVAALRARFGESVEVVSGGRSMGARVACRTAAQVGAAGVLCLAFPLQPRPRAGKPVPDRLHELDAVAAPTLVVQGARDAFGMPPPARGRSIVEVAGDHSLKADLPAVAGAVETWLEDLLD